MRLLRPVPKLPEALRSGSLATVLNRSVVDRRDELAVTVALLCQRQLFGSVYYGLQPDYFWSMPPSSGVLLAPVVPTACIAPGATKPGDIDLLIIPYEGQSIVLDRIMAIEIKIVRATYARQDRSPNEFGYSQAAGLSKLGFPYVALIHLVISDASPREAWRPTSVVEILDSFGRVKQMPDIEADLMPVDLINRSYGRLLSNSQDSTLGLAAAYVGAWDRFGDELRPSSHLWIPSCRQALRHSPILDLQFLNRVGDYFDANTKRFLNTPRHDPPR